ncbi:MAG TPA: GMC family oxidoreductase [Ochrobactrum intermedium]|uniref:GMC family oxidoreductase n=1 Tax=Brucella intermedia TaxID=94625 RepID=A0A7V6PBN3_9HYPH|nr:GMC family oxidoreductase [Brucella intermedia]
MEETYDYIVVGAGSAGCVVTTRLILAGKSVLLLECGPEDNDPFIHVPGGFVKAIKPKRTFMFKTEPQAGTGNRSLTIPQGRTIGGGSSVNAMIYIRGQAQDYDDWADLGCKGWDYESVLPAFKKCEQNQKFANFYHGTEGPLAVSDAGYRHPLSYAFLRAAQEAGFQYNDDFNGISQEGFGFYQTTTANGRRGSAAGRYLSKVRNNRLLTVRTNAEASAIFMENGAASGVHYRAGKRPVTLAKAKEEVILCAGALNTPKLLMLSGIGPGEQLRKFDITVIRDLHGVGKNFQDHVAASVHGVTDRKISLYKQDKGLRAVKNALIYMLTRGGVLSSNIVESGGFLDTAGSGRPDIQFHVTPALVGDANRTPMPFHGISINPCVLRPTSRGEVSLASKLMSDQLVIRANTLGTEQDVDTLLRGIEIGRKILASPAFQKLGFSEFSPGLKATSRDKIVEYIRCAAKTVYHPVGTCKMGEDDLAVVDSQLRVRGVSRLRIADGSVMPALVSGNTNAPCIMIGERCSEFILGR